MLSAVAVLRSFSFGFDAVSLAHFRLAKFLIIFTFDLSLLKRIGDDNSWFTTVLVC